MIVAILAGLWFVCALALRSRVQAGIGWILVLTGIPMLGLVTWQVGPLCGFAALAVASILLRTPLRHMREPARGTLG